MSQPSTTRRTSIVSSTTPDSPLKATSIETRQVTSSVASTSALTPTTASTSASGSLSIPATSSSPSRKIDEQHKAQLASYKRDPARAAAANRINRVSEAWAGAGRRVSTVDEVDESGDGDDGKSKWKSKSSFLQTKRDRWIFYGLSALVFYVFVVRPYLRPLDHNDHTKFAPSPLSTEKPRTASLAPLHSRRKASSLSASSSSNNVTSLPEGQRAPLPPSSHFNSAPSHPIENGLLRVRSDSPVHPIYQLIRDARDEWDNKVARQSRTLKEAVEEYKRRYRFEPPRGFDKWWAYVCKHHVLLPDEYDQIFSDIKPFHALSPKDLNNRISQASKLQDTYTLTIRKGQVRTSSTFGEIGGADMRLTGQSELLKPVARWIDDMTVVYSVHDTPTALLGWDHRQDLSDHVEEGEYIDADDEIDLSLRGWTSACPPHSAMRTFKRYQHPVTSTPDTSLSSKTFIADHHQTMDLCSHPEAIPLHGVLSGRNPPVQTLTPIFSLSKTILHGDILGVPTEQFPEFTSIRYIPFEEKRQDKALWRGSNTGAYYSSETTWRASHRTRLIRLAHMPEGPTLNVLPAPKGMRGRKVVDLIDEIQWTDANEFYTDIAFTGSPIQCDHRDGTCDELRTEFTFGNPMSHDDALEYKYVIDVDGNAWSARFKRLLTSGSLIFKSTIMPEWWTDRIQPWVHYVPFKIDYSDLYDVLTFFRGDLGGKGGEHLIAQDIAKAGREYSRTLWRKQDMTAYVFRLYLEWARLVAPARKPMDFVYHEEMEMNRKGV